MQNTISSKTAAALPGKKTMLLQRLAELEAENEAIMRERERQKEIEKAQRPYADNFIPHMAPFVPLFKKLAEQKVDREIDRRDRGVTTRQTTKAILPRHTFTSAPPGMTYN